MEFGREWLNLLHECSWVEQDKLESGVRRERDLVSTDRASGVAIGDIDGLCAERGPITAEKDSLEIEECDAFLAGGDPAEDALVKVGRHDHIVENDEVFYPLPYRE